MDDIKELQRRLRVEREIIGELYRHAEKQADKINEHAAEVAALQAKIEEVKNA